MTITIGGGNPIDIHPRNKLAVGHRLSDWALGEVHGRAVPSVSGPLFTGFEESGNRVEVTFDHEDQRLVVHGDELSGFEVADESGAWHVARAHRGRQGRRCFHSGRAPHRRALRLGAVARGHALQRRGAACLALHDGQPGRHDHARPSAGRPPSCPRTWGRTRPTGLGPRARRSRRAGGWNSRTGSGLRRPLLHRVEVHDGLFGPVCLGQPGDALAVDLKQVQAARLGQG